MESQFRQPKQVINVEVNKQSVARNFGIGDNEVCYAKPGQPLAGYKVIYDKAAQRAYYLPTGLTGTVVSISIAGVLTHSDGTVDLGALAVTREEFVTLPGSFSSGSTINAKNERLEYQGGLYRWDGALPKIVTPGSVPDVGIGKWIDTATKITESLPKPVTWSGFAGGADSTGTNSSDAAFAAAEAYDKEVYIPSGTYKLNSNYSGRFTFADGVIFSGAGVAFKKNTGFNASPSTAASIDRFNRLFVGDVAYSNDGREGGSTTWLGQKDYIAPNGSRQPGLTWPERTAQFASVTSQGGCAVMGGAHTKELTGGSSQALVGIAVNDNESVLTSCRAMYLDGKRYPNSIGPAYAAELQITNLGTFVDEYASSSKKTFGLSIFAGGDPVINNNTDDATLAIAIANNGAKFGTGITFAPLALRIIQEAGLNDYGRAMTLRGGQRIGWEDSVGNTRAYINSVVTDDTRKVGVFFQNGVVDIKGPSSPAFRASGDVGDTAYLRARSGNGTSQLVRLEVEGETNCSMSLEGRGTGNIIVNKALRPSAANALSCGTASFPWSGGFTQTAFTVTSDETHKTKPIDISDAILDAAEEVQLMQYQYLDRVEAKGLDGARWHFGAIAQRYVEAFARHGLDAHRFAFICYDEWDDQYAQVQTNEGEVVVKTRLVEKPVLVTKTRTVSRPVMTTMVRDVLVDEVLEDGTRIKKVIQEEYQAPQQSQVYIFNEDGSPHLNDKGEHLFVNEPVMQDVIEEYSEWINEEHEEEYTEPAAPEYENVLTVPAGSRYGIRYEEMLVLEAAVQRRNYERMKAQYEVLVTRVEALETK